MSDALAVIAVWSTDAGRLESRRVYSPDTDLRAALQDLANGVESEGRFIVKLSRVFTQTVPMVGGKPSWTLAGPLRRENAALFRVTQLVMN